MTTNVPPMIQMLSPEEIKTECSACGKEGTVYDSFRVYENDNDNRECEVCYAARIRTCYATNKTLTARAIMLKNFCFQHDNNVSIFGWCLFGIGFVMLGFNFIFSGKIGMANAVLTSIAVSHAINFLVTMLVGVKFNVRVMWSLLYECRELYLLHSVVMLFRAGMVYASIFTPEYVWVGIILVFHATYDLHLKIYGYEMDTRCQDAFITGISEKYPNMNQNAIFFYISNLRLRYDISACAHDLLL